MTLLHYLACSETRGALTDIFFKKFTAFSIRVSNDLENLEMSGNFDARRKNQGIFKKQENSGESQEI